MYLTHMKALVATAFEEALANPNHPVLGDPDSPTFAGSKIWVGRSYPEEETNYPGVWVDYIPNGAMSAAGIAHIEQREDSQGRIVEGTRWVFSGTLTATVVALDDRQRDELLDEVVRLVAFGNEHPQTSILRQRIENNPLISVRVNWTQMNLVGLTESPGTPWGTNDLVWEGTVSLSCEGEFVSDLERGMALVPLEEIRVYDYATPVQAVPEGTDDPAPWV